MKKKPNMEIKYEKTRQIRYEKGRIWEILVTDNKQIFLQHFRSTDSAPVHEDCPAVRTSAAATALSQLTLRRRRYRLPDQLPSFHRFKLRQGAKWTKRPDNLLLQ
jgi:hypothetical protein